METITEGEFIRKACQEHCQADLSERTCAVSPRHVKDKCFAQELFTRKTYPLWRTNRDATAYVGNYKIPPDQAFLISYIEFSKKPLLFSKINFDPRENYLKSVCIIAFYCQICSVYVVAHLDSRCNWSVLGHPGAYVYVCSYCCHLRARCQK